MQFQGELFYAMATRRSDGLYQFGTFTDNACLNAIGDPRFASARDLGKCQDTKAQYGLGRWSITSSKIELPVRVEWKSRCLAASPCSCDVAVGSHTRIHTHTHIYARA
jgi:hypothetical protein